jgi:hypothetical protein
MQKVVQAALHRFQVPLKVFGPEPSFDNRSSALSGLGQFSTSFSKPFPIEPAGKAKAAHGNDSRESTYDHRTKTVLINQWKFSKKMIKEK